MTDPAPLTAPAAATVAAPAPAPAPASAPGRGWALAAVLVLVTWSYVSAALGTVVNRMVLRQNDGNLVLMLASWFQCHVFATVLLCLAAASLRRLGLSVVALLAALVEAGALGGFLVLNLADLSISAGVLDERVLTRQLIPVVLGLLGVVASVVRRRRVWPPAATLGVVLAELAIVWVLFRDQFLVLLGRYVQAPPLAGPLLTAAIPLAVVLVGLAVALRRWPLAAAAAMVLVVALVPVVGSALGQSRGSGLIWTLFRVLDLLKIAALLIAAGACVGLVLALRRPRSGEPRQ